MKPLVLTILICLISLAVSAEQVFEQEGSIYFIDKDGRETQLTSFGVDRAPILSPDRKAVAFIRKSDEEAYLAVGAEEDYTPEGLLADQVWIVNIDDKQERMLVKNRRPDPDNSKGDGVTEELKKTIAHIDGESLQFSPDGKRIYFITSAWVTSGAVHCVNTNGTDEHFVIASNSLMVIDKGRYKGHLIVRQHNYFLGAGSYDWLWMFTPEGKKVGPIGVELTDNQKKTLFSE